MKRPFQISYLAIIFAILYLPILIVVVFSFNNSQRSLLWHGFTWHWYQILFQDHDIFITVGHSLSIGLLASTIATILGAIATITLYRYRFAGRHLINMLLFLLIIVPDLILAIGWLLMFLFIHIPLGFWSLLIAHSSFCIPFVFVTVNSRIVQLNKYLIEAARDLGAGETRILLQILLPLLMPALLAGWLLSFTLSIDDTIISYFVTGPEYQTLPLKIYALVKVGMNPEINALCSIILLFTIAIVFLVYQFTIKRPSRLVGHAK